MYLPRQLQSWLYGGRPNRQGWDLGLGEPNQAMNPLLPHSIMSHQTLLAGVVDQRVLQFMRL